MIAVQVATTLDVLRTKIASLRRGGASVAMVPTMGALHDGHLTLVRRARDACDHVVASIFVNPTQFGPNEDLDAYPRQLEADADLLEAEGCALLWAPETAEMYPEGFATNISLGGISEVLDGSSRPGHFDGVATVVNKLFNQIQPDMAFFGEKDFQQLAIIRAMARDLDLTRPHVRSIIGVRTVRESDGLAMSSRNRYLSADHRQAASVLPQAMQTAIAAIEAGKPVPAALTALKGALTDAGFDEPDYAVLADSATLQELDALGDAPARLLVAVKIAGTRLIDNMPVG